MLNENYGTESLAATEDSKIGSPLATARAPYSLKAL